MHSSRRRSKSVRSARPFKARDGAVRVGPRRRPAQRRYCGPGGCAGYLDDPGGGRNPDARFYPRRVVQLSGDRGRHPGRADVRQPVGQCARRSRQSLSSPAAGRRRTGGRSCQRATRAPDRASRCRGRAGPGGTGPAGRRIRRRAEAPVPGERMEDIGDQRSHGLTGWKVRSSATCMATTSSPMAP